MVRQRIRLHFSKTGNLRFIGHRDLLRMMERLFRRAQTPLVLTQGFHPKPKVSYLSALPLGFSSTDEVMEIVVEGQVEPDVLLKTLNSSGINGLDFTQATLLNEGASKGKAVSYDYEMIVPAQYSAEVQQKISSILGASSLDVAKTNGKIVDARLAILHLTLKEIAPKEMLLKERVFCRTNNFEGSNNGNHHDSRRYNNDSTQTGDFLLELTLAVQDGPEAGVKEVLFCLGLVEQLFRSIFPVRTKTTYY